MYVWRVHSYVRSTGAIHGVPCTIDDGNNNHDDGHDGHTYLFSIWMLQFMSIAPWKCHLLEAIVVQRVTLLEGYVISWIESGICIGVTYCWGAVALAGGVMSYDPWLYQPPHNHHITRARCCTVHTLPTCYLQPILYGVEAWYACMYVGQTAIVCRLSFGKSCESSYARVGLWGRGHSTVTSLWWW